MEHDYRKGLTFVAYVAFVPTNSTYLVSVTGNLLEAKEYECDDRIESEREFDPGNRLH